MILTDQQVRFFNTFGYLVLKGLFSETEIGLLASEFDLSMNRQGVDVDSGGCKRRHLDSPIEHTERLCSLLDDDRIVNTASALLGDDFNYAGGDGTCDAGDTLWHIDGNWGEHFAAKMIFFLDPVRSDTGCLRVVPGSHRPDHHIRAYHLDPNRARELFGIDPRDFPGNVPLEADPGDLIVFDHDIYHALYGGECHRREFTLNLTKHCHNAVDMMSLREYLRVNGRRDRTRREMYTQLMTDTAGPGRLAHLDQLTELYAQLHRAEAA